MTSRWRKVVLGWVFFLPILAACQNGERNGEEGEEKAFSPEELIEEHSDPLVDPEDPSVEEKNRDRVERLRKALELLGAFGRTLSEEERTRLSGWIEALKEAIAAGKLRIADLGGGKVLGFTWNGWVVIGRRFLDDPGDPFASRTFIDLLDILVHEGVHLTQPLPANPPPDGAPPEDVIVWKLGRIADEWQAYQEDILFKQGVLAALARILDNKSRGKPPMEGVPPFGSAWSGLSLGGLRDLIDKATQWIREKGEKLEAFEAYVDPGGKPLSLDEIRRRWKEGGEVVMGVPFDPEGYARHLQAFTTGRFIQVELDGDGRFYRIDSRQSRLERPDAGSSGGHMVPPEPRYLETGIPHPVDAVLWMHGGKPHLVVCGFDGWDLDEDEGRIRIFPPVGKGHPDYPGFGAAPIVALKTRRFRPLSVAVGPQDTIHVFDATRFQLRPLEDGDGDGLPDRLGPSIIEGPAPPDKSHVTDILFMDGHPFGRVRVTEPLGQPLLFFRRKPDGRFTALGLR